MIILVGASASGKTEIATLLYKIYGYHKCITTTTRPPRKHETNGVDYHFLSTSDFISLKSKNRFIEVTEYQHAYYGLQLKDIDQKGIVILDPNGANAVIEALNDKVYLVCVQAQEVIRAKRMMMRGDDHITIEKRLLNDQVTFQKSHLLRINLLIQNDDTSLEDQTKRIHESYQTYLKIR